MTTVPYESDRVKKLKTQFAQAMARERSRGPFAMGTAPSDLQSIVQKHAAPVPFKPGQKPFTATPTGPFVDGVAPQPPANVPRPVPVGTETPPTFADNIFTAGGGPRLSDKRIAEATNFVDLFGIKPAAPEPRPTGTPIEVDDDEIDNTILSKALSDIRPVTAGPVSTRLPERMGDLSEDDVNEFLKGLTPDNIADGTVALLFGAMSLFQAVDEPAAALLLSTFMPGVKKRSAELREGGMSPYNAAIQAYNESVGPLTRMLTEFAVSPTWLAPIIGAPGGVLKLAKGATGLARGAVGFGGMPARNVARNWADEIVDELRPRFIEGRGGKALEVPSGAGQGGDELLPELGTDAGRHAALKQLDDQIEAITRTTPSAGPPLGASSGAEKLLRAGVGPGVNVRDLLTERAKVVRLMAEDYSARSGVPVDDLLAIHDQYPIFGDVPGATQRAAERVAQAERNEGVREALGFGEIAGAKVTPKDVDDAAFAARNQKVAGEAVDQAVIDDALDQAILELALAQARVHTRRSPGAGQDALFALKQRVIGLAKAASKDPDESIRLADEMAIDQAEGVLERAVFGTSKEPLTQVGPLTKQPPVEVRGGGGLPSGRVPGGPHNQRNLPAPALTDEQKIATLYGGKRPGLEDFPTRIAEAFIDPARRIQKVGKRIGDEVAAKLAQLVSGARGEADMIVDRDWMPVIRSVGHDKGALQDLMVLRRLRELRGRFGDEYRIPGKFERTTEVDKAIDDIAARIGRERFQKVVDAADQLDVLSRQELDYMLSVGRLTKTQHDIIVENNKHYIPLFRDDFDDMVGAAKGQRKSTASVQSAEILTLDKRGSTRPIVDDSLDQLVNSVVRNRTWAARNQAAEAAVETLRIADQIDGTALVRQVTGKAEHSRLVDTISYFKAGEELTFEVPAEFAVWAKRLNAEQSHIIMRIIRGATAPFRYGAIAYNPTYPPVAIARDTWAAAFREGLVPFGKEWREGLVSAFKKNDLHQETARIRAHMGGIAEQMLRPSRANLAGAIQVKSPADVFLVIPRLLKETPGVMRDFNATLEQGMRNAVNLHLKNAGVIDEIERAVRVRDATVDFAKMGHLMEVVNTVLPFTNAGLQGNINMLRTMHDHPGRSLVWFAAVSSTAAAIDVNNRRFETSRDIPLYEYARNWVIQVGEGTRQDGTKYPIYFKIPKAEILGMLAMPIEAWLHAERQEGRAPALDIFIEAGLDQLQVLSPVSPGPSQAIGDIPVISTAASIATNTDFFTGGSIVPRRLQELPPEEQFDETTSKTAIAIGSKLRISPKKIDFLIRDYFAGAGDSASWLLGTALAATGYDPERFGQVDEEPVTGFERVNETPLRRFIGTRATEPIRRGFDNLAEAQIEGNRAFLDLPDVRRLGISLGTLDATVKVGSKEVELTPQQRADLQVRYTEAAIERVGVLVSDIDDRTPDDQREVMIRRSLSRARAQAKEDFIREVILGSPSRPTPPSTASGQDAQRRFFQQAATGSAAVPTTAVGQDAQRRLLQEMAAR